MEGSSLRPLPASPHNRARERASFNEPIERGGEDRLHTQTPGKANGSNE